MDNVPLLDANPALAIALNFIFGDHVEDGRTNIRPSESEQDCSLSYPRSISLKKLASNYSLRRLESDIKRVVDNGGARLGYTRGHGPNSHSFQRSPPPLSPRALQLQRAGSDYSGEVRPLMLSLIDQPEVGFPSQLRPKGLSNEINNWEKLIDFILLLWTHLRGY